MKRQIIKIDDEKCNGCGLCIPDCPEGALLLIDGKARLLSDLFCDGLGACIGTCPEGAISVEQREAQPYDERKVMENIIGHGMNTIIAHLKHLDDHGETGFLKTALEYLGEKEIEVPGYGGENGSVGAGEVAAESGGGCSGCLGSMAIDMREGEKNVKRPYSVDGEIESELRQWPVQLKLLNPGASYFDDADLLVAADCSPFSYADFHRKFVKGKIVIMFCPKLDQGLDDYIDKLAAIFSNHRIHSITILKMEVPCCNGVTMIIKKAMEKAGVDIALKEITVSVGGKLL